ncbi:hypothetical protein AC579_2623 [Pseudocercospora musae]|uniref:Uncharacterized protein n=1 Tax=Pseudocercospora musae TaxID=113226 RepID=A0A139IGS1_9PEZI|nr:hypothetical protein AC579_2623 [Pseudocercospora musae]
MSLEKLGNDAQRYVDTARRWILELARLRLPEDRNTRLFLAGGSLSVAGIVLCPLLHYAILGRQLTHTYPNASSRYASLECGEISSLPKHLVENPKQYRIVHDKVTKPIPELTLALSEDSENAFTKLLRYNMELITRTPQGWIGWLALKHSRHTFSKDYIESLDFEEGDLVNGLYEVVKRTAVHVEFKINPPPEFNPGIEGRLIIQLRPRNQGAVLQTETIQWSHHDNRLTHLPLESRVIRFLHDWAERWIAIKGAQYLLSISK